MKEDYIKNVKQLRVDMDEFIQRADELFTGMSSDISEECDNINEVMANRMLAKRHLEDASMRFGMVLKHMGNPNPYPNSRDTTNAVVDKTADTFEKVKESEEDTEF